MAAWDKDLDKPVPAWEQDLDKPTSKATPAPSAPTTWQQRLLVELGNATGLPQLAKSLVTGDPKDVAAVAAAPAVRFAVGAGTPIIGIADRLAGNSGVVQGFNRLAQEGGATGFDVAGLAGGVLNPLGLTAAKAIPLAGTMTGKTLQGVGMGAAGGFLAPAEDNTEAAKNALLGASIGGVLPPLVQAGSASINALNRKLIQPFADLFRPSGPENIGARIVANKIGSASLPEVQSAARSASDILPNGVPTLAQATAGSPVGSAVSALEQRVATMPANGGKVAPSTLFGERWQQQQNAIKAAEEARDAMTGPLRETALKNANIWSDVAPTLQAKVDQMSGGAASKVEDVRRFMSAADRAAERANTTTGPNQAALTSVPGYPRQPGRYTYMGDLEKAARNVANESADTSNILGDAARFAKMQRDSLEANGYFPLSPARVTDKIDALANTPGYRPDDVIQGALGMVKSKISKWTNPETGAIDSRDLYTIRKNIGSLIEKYADENKQWDKRLTAGLVKSVEHKIDDAIESAGGSGWKDYLSKYASASKAIDTYKARQELASNPLQKTNLGSNVTAGETAIPAPHLISQKVAIANFALKMLGHNIEPAVNDAVARIILNPRQFDNVMARLTPTQVVDANKVLQKANAFSFGTANALSEQRQ